MRMKMQTFSFLCTVAFILIVFLVPFLVPGCSFGGDPPVGSESSEAAARSDDSSRSTHPRFTPHGPLDDPAALPGQIIVAGGRPGYLKYNGGGPAFLCGTGNPEVFFFLGTLNEDGTRSGNRQEELIEIMAQSGMNGFQAQMFRMRRCNIKDEGNDQHSPFVDFDPSKPLNEKALDQWDGWISQMEEVGIVIQLMFYNDATDVELMGWTLQEDGELHPDEKRFVEGIVNRFKHHKNVIWGLEETMNKLPRARKQHFMKMSELIAQVDNHNHPILLSFTTPDTSEEDIHEDRVMSHDYRDDPNIDIVTWLHVLPHAEDYEAQYQDYLKYARLDRDRFITMKSGTEPPSAEPNQTLSRRYTWACAMTGMHCLEEWHSAVRWPELLPDDGRVAKFMEQTDFYTMQPRSDLTAGSTKWVLANPGESYIAYTYDYSGPMGVKDIPGGTYELTWFDTVHGDTVTKPAVAVSSGQDTWNKPGSFGSEIALYIKRQASPR